MSAGPDAHLAATFPYPYRITIADNASTDATWAIATDMGRWRSAVEALRLPQKGRGRALTQTWLASDATILAYVDIDLSMDLDALLPAPRRSAPAGSSSSASRAGSSSGLASTALHLGLLALLMTAGMAAQAANITALLLSTVANTSTNRTWTFGAARRSSAIHAQHQGLAVLCLCWACSSAALGALSPIATDAGRARPRA